MNTPDIVFIGLGEAGQAFAGQLACASRGYDRKQDAAKRAEFDANHVGWASSNAEAVADAPLIVSLVTADQALLAAEETSRSIAHGALFCDLNSVAPDTKRAATKAIEAAGGLYVDVAVMAPVHPQRLKVPMLVSGPHAEAGAAALRVLGFQTRIVGTAIGDASAIKMIRSVMVKGIEALSAECALAAHAAGVEAEVLASLDKSWKEQSWAERFDYNLDRMLIHGLRRAAEMEEVVKTLDGLGTGSQMTRGTVQRQRAIGAIGEGAPDGLQAKVDLIKQTFVPSEVEGRSESQRASTSLDTNGVGTSHTNGDGMPKEKAA
jgi:3-hydroxyisobutyrate dehydrogenase-like beta-hydroxyacid dehydrogenase